MQRKRKVNPRNLTIVVVILLLILGGIWGGWFWWDKHIQQVRHETVAAILESREEALEQLNAWENTRALDTEAFDALKAEALADNAAAYTRLSEKQKDRLTKEVVDEAEALDLENDGLRYLNLYNDPGLPDDYLVFLSRDNDRLDRKSVV